jgi:uncharacterized protein
MTYRKENNTIVVRLLHGEEIISEITEICEQEKIMAGYIPVAIGGLQEAELISMKSADKVLINEQIKHIGPFEVQGVGTIAAKDGKPVPHVHITLARFGNQTVGGHLVSGKVALFMEIVIVKTDIKMLRTKDKFDLYLLNFE